MSETGAPEEEPEIPVPAPTREVINLPSWVTFAEPTVATGQPYYELTRFRFVDEADAGGKTNIFILDPHNPALKIKVTNTGTGAVAEIPLDKPIGEPAANVPMFGIGNFYTVEMTGLPSVAVKGMHLPGNRHVVYELTFARKVKEGEMPEPVPTPQPVRFDKVSWAMEQAARILKNEGYLSSHDWILACESYLEAKNNRKTLPLPTQEFVINTSRQSPNFDDRPVSPNVVVLHHTGGGLSASLNTLCSPTSGVSCHYVVGKEGEIYGIVPEGKRAWHAGASIFKGREDTNDYSIGIEIVNAGNGTDPYPAKQQDALVCLLSDIARRRGITRDNGTTHKAVAVPPGRKTDPAGLDVNALLDRVYRAKQQAA